MAGLRRDARRLAGVVVANFVTLALAACILTMKIVLGRGGSA